MQRAHRGALSELVAPSLEGITAALGRGSGGGCVETALVACAAEWFDPNVSGFYGGLTKNRLFWIKAVELRARGLDSVPLLPGLCWHIAGFAVKTEGQRSSAEACTFSVRLCWAPSNPSS